MYRNAAFTFLTGVLLALPASAQTVAVGTGDRAVTLDTATPKNVTTAKKLATAKNVATVNVVSGQASINRGEGFKPVVKTTPANVGDQVMVRPDSQAKIVYAEGCEVEVNPGAVVGVAGSCKVAMAKPMTAGLEVRWSRLIHFRGGQQQSGPQWLWAWLASASARMMRITTVTVTTAEATTDVCTVDSECKTWQRTALAELNSTAFIRDCFLALPNMREITNPWGKSRWLALAPKLTKLSR